MYQTDHVLSKKEVRLKIRELKSTLSEDQMDEWSWRIGERVFELLKDREPAIVSLFLSMPDEVRTGHLIDLLWKQGKHKVVVPRVEDKTTMCFYSHLPHKELHRSNYGILEPTDDPSLEQVPEIMIVPGVAFDLKGGRVGYGRGYYDRYFSKHQETITDKIAICYDLQILDEVPMDEYDQRMHRLITEKRSISF